MVTSRRPIRAATAKPRGSRRASPRHPALRTFRIRREPVPNERIVVLRMLSWIAVAIVALAALLFLPLPWPDTFVGSRVVNRIEIAAPPERVFAYVTTPANWPRWHPA